MEQPAQTPPMVGKTVIVTGAGSGMGLESADALARQGASLVLIELLPDRGEAAVARLAKRGRKPALFIADLSRQSEVRRVAGEILTLTPRIDVLINNAGAMFNTRHVTPDGLEKTFALNHMGYFLLTNLLLNRIINSAPARIISVSSGAHRLVGSLDFDDLQSEQNFSGPEAYYRSKLANIMFSRALARRLHSTGVTANSLDPGMVRSRFFENVHGRMRLIASIMGPLIGVTPAVGARTAIYLASSAEVAGISGKHFAKCKVATTSTVAEDDSAAEQLWTASLRLAGL